MIGASVKASAWGHLMKSSVQDSVWNSVRYFVWDSMRDFIQSPVRLLVWNSVRGSIQDSVRREDGRGRLW